MSTWVKCTNWADLPNGEWLVKLDIGHNPYHVAVVTPNVSGGRLIIVGGYFSWDMGSIEAYTTFDRYGE